MDNFNTSGTPSSANTGQSLPVSPPSPGALPLPEQVATVIPPTPQPADVQSSQPTVMEPTSVAAQDNLLSVAPESSAMPAATTVQSSTPENMIASSTSAIQPPSAHGQTGTSTLRSESAVLADGSLPEGVPHTAEASATTETSSLTELPMTARPVVPLASQPVTEPAVVTASPTVEQPPSPDSADTQELTQPPAPASDSMVFDGADPPSIEAVVGLDTGA